MGKQVLFCPQITPFLVRICKIRKKLRKNGYFLFFSFTFALELQRCIQLCSREVRENTGFRSLYR